MCSTSPYTAHHYLHYFCLNIMRSCSLSKLYNNKVYSHSTEQLWVHTFNSATMFTNLQQSNRVYSHSTAQTGVLTFNLSNHVYSHSTEQQCVLTFNSANLCTHIQPEQPCVLAFNRATMCIRIQQSNSVYSYSTVHEMLCFNKCMTDEDKPDGTSFLQPLPFSELSVHHKPQIHLPHSKNFTKQKVKNKIGEGL